MRAAADQRQGTVQAPVQGRQRRRRRAGTLHTLGGVGEIEQGAIDIEEQGPVARKGGGGAGESGRSALMHCIVNMAV